MKVGQLAAVAVIAFAGLACSSDSRERQLPTQPTPPTPTTTEPRPEPPPPAPPGARRIEVGAVTSDVLTNSRVPAGCPPTDDYPGMLIPCRHFEVVAPADGILRVEVVFTPHPGAEGVRLLVAGVNHRDFNNLNAPVGSHRILSGHTYGISVVYDPSHYDYLFLGPDRIGEFTLKATFEPRTWS